MLFGVRDILATVITNGHVKKKKNQSVVSLLTLVFTSETLTNQHVAEITYFHTGKTLLIHTGVSFYLSSKFILLKLE